MQASRRSHRAFNLAESALAAPIWRIPVTAKSAGIAARHQCQARSTSIHSRSFSRIRPFRMAIGLAIIASLLAWLRIRDQLPRDPPAAAHFVAPHFVGVQTGANEPAGISVVQSPGPPLKSVLADSEAAADAAADTARAVFGADPNP